MANVRLGNTIIVDSGSIALPTGRLHVTTFFCKKGTVNFNVAGTSVCLLTAGQAVKPDTSFNDLTVGDTSANSLAYIYLK